MVWVERIGLCGELLMLILVKWRVKGLRGIPRALRRLHGVRVGLLGMLLEGLRVVWRGWVVVGGRGALAGDGRIRRDFHSVITRRMPVGRSEKGHGLDARKKLEKME